MDELLAGITLNDNQRRHFEVLLTRLEDSLSTIEVLLAAPPVRHSGASSARRWPTTPFACKSLSSQIRGYGAVDPSVAERLDPALLRLAESLQRLGSALKR
jgi:hypothetical protein